MIGEALLNVGLTLIRFIFGSIEVFSLPSDMIGVLYDLMCYGTWVVGSDVLLLCSGCFTFWVTTRMFTGFAIWIWEQISPLF